MSAVFESYKPCGTTVNSYESYILSAKNENSKDTWPVIRYPSSKKREKDSTSLSRKSFNYHNQPLTKYSDSSNKAQDGSNGIAAHQKKSSTSQRTSYSAGMLIEANEVTLRSRDGLRSAALKVHENEKESQYDSGSSYPDVKIWL